MKVIVRGEGEINLTPKYSLASGGEGEVFVIGSTAYKVYHNPSKMLPEGKIQDLIKIQEPRVIRPQKVLTDAHGKPVGYTMRYVPNASPSCKFFTPAFRDREGVTHDQIRRIVQNLRVEVAGVHQANIQVVDLNELNVLIADDLSDCYLIDTDSFQTSHYPATAIMDSIRDPFCDYAHGKANEGSDWYSFGVLSFQLFCGIHPFKGKHPIHDGMTARMAAQIPVLDASVKLPKAVYPFTVIPSGYLDWYNAIFRDGKRLPPPVDLTGAAIIVTPVVRQSVKGSAKLELVPIWTMNEDVKFCTGDNIIVCTDGVYEANRRLSGSLKGFIGAVRTPRTHQPVLITLVGHQVQFHCNGVTQTFALNVDAATIQDGRAYFKVGESIHELAVFESGNNLVFASNSVSQCMAYATQMFDGVAIQNLLGTFHAVIFPAHGTCYNIGLPSLKGRKPLAGKMVRNVLVVDCAYTGKYERHVFRFNSEWDSFDTWVIPLNGPSVPNFTVLESGVAALISEDDNLELFSAKKGAPMTAKVIADPMLGQDMQLTKVNGKVAVWRGNVVYQMSTK